MPGSALWFVGVLMALPTAWFAGRACARIKDPLRRGCVIGAGFLLLLGWSALIRHPARRQKLLDDPSRIPVAVRFMFLMGLTQRSISSTAVGIFDGSSRSF